MPVKSTDSTVIIPRQLHFGADQGPQTTVLAPSEAPQKPEALEAPWLTVVSWVFPMLLMGSLGAFRLSSPGLWEDELASLSFVSASWSEFWSIIRNLDATIAPYYLLLRAWTTIAGTSDLALRIPSVLAMAGTAGLVSVLGTKVGGRRVGLIAGVLFALVPTTSRYAQECRPYAFAMFAAVLATLLLAGLLEEVRTGRLLGYLGAVLLLGSAHVVALLLLAAHGWVVWKNRATSRLLPSWIAATGIAVLLNLPLLYFGYRQSANQIGWIPRLSVKTVCETPAVLFGGPFLAGAVVALALTAMSMRQPAAILTAWASVPALGLLAVSAISPMWLPRYLLFVLPAWALLGSLALRKMTLLRGVALVLAITALAVPEQLAIRTPFGHGQGTKDIAAIMVQHAGPDDAVIYGPSTTSDQHVSRDAVLRYVPTAHRPADPLVRVAPHTAGRLGAKECPDQEVARCLGKPTRVWLVRMGTLADPVAGAGTAKETVLRADYTTGQKWQVKGFTVALLNRKPGK